MNISSVSLASTLSPPARLAEASSIATRMNSPSHEESSPSTLPLLITGGRLSNSGLNGWASQARKPHTSLTEGGRSPPPSLNTSRKNGSMPGALDMTCGSPLVKTTTSPALRWTGSASPMRAA